MLLAAGSCSGLAGTALAQSRPGGGAVYVERPEVTSVKCVRRCASKARAKEGSTLRLTGRALASISYVTFHGTFGRADDTYAKVRPAGPTRPERPRARGSGERTDLGLRRSGPRAHRTPPLSILPPPEPEPNATLTPVPGALQGGAPRLETGTSRTKAFYGARRAVTFSFRVSGPAPSSLRVELIRARDASVVQTWTPAAAVGAVQSVVWNGGAGGAFAGPGRYAFRLTAANASGALARSSQTAELTRDAFDLYDHTFPVRGAHDFGGAGARFGAGRGGRRHQGHDVMARCGTRMVAARGGRVQFKGYHRRGRQLPRDRRGRHGPRLRLHAPRRADAVREGRPRLHRPADRLGGRDRQRPRLPPALRDVGRAGLVLGRPALQPAPRPSIVGWLELMAADYTVKQLEDAPDVLGDYPGEMRMSPRPSATSRWRSRGGGCRRTPAAAAPTAISTPAGGDLLRRRGRAHVQVRRRRVQGECRHRGANRAGDAPVGAQRHRLGRRS